MKSPRHIAADLWMLKQRLLRARSAAGLRFLIFHHVRPSEERSFTELVDYLQQRDLIAAPEVVSGEFEGVRFVLSFDDGFASNYDTASRLLTPRGVRALFFVCPAFIGLPDARAAVSEYVVPGEELPADYLAELAFMSWDEIRELRRQGHTIGSHAMRHRRLSATSEDLLQEEIVSSGDVLANELGEPVSWFAWPFGDLASIDERSLAIIDSRYAYYCSGIRGLNALSARRRALYRDHVDLGAPLNYQLMAAFGGLDLAYAGKRRQLDLMLPRGGRA